MWNHFAWTKPHPSNTDERLRLVWNPVIQLANLPNEDSIQFVCKESKGMSNGLGLFGWIRDGVKQSVLLGVSDAIDTIGSPDERRELNPALLSFARQGVEPALAVRMEEPARKLGATSGSAASRKRLGRSLRDIEPTKPAQS
jgi:hypothetical protein